MSQAVPLLLCVMLAAMAMSSANATAAEPYSERIGREDDGDAALDRDVFGAISLASDRPILIRLPFVDSPTREDLFGLHQTPPRLTQQVMASEDDVDIAEPGPDMGDFPNSAYTLRRGRLLIESAPVTFVTKTDLTPSAYQWPYLIRYGLTDDVEFRMSGNGLTSFISPTQSTGLDVLILGTKIHLWDDRIETLIPAASFEATLQTELGSPAFRAGIEPSLNVNLDFPFTDRTNIETTISYSGSLVSVNPLGNHLASPEDSMQFSANVYFWSVQWALEQQVTEKVQEFVHGYYATPVGVAGDAGVVVGAGFFYQLSRRAMLFGSANGGLTDVVPPFSTQLGLAFAF